MVELMQTYWWAILIALLVVGILLYVAQTRPRGADAEISPNSTSGAAIDSAQSAASTTSAAPPEGTGATSPAVVSANTAAMPNIAVAIGEPDNLLQIKGIGPKLSALCHTLGVTRFDQIAKWGPSDIAEVDQHLGTFRGRIERDSWVEQAGLLASGHYAAFDAKFGKLDSEKK